MKYYFNYLEELLSTQGKLSSFSEHKPDIGTNREDALIDILNKHLPERLKAISGGSIINLKGEKSRQMDIIIKSDIFPNFGSTSKPQVITESVAGVISVKSTLNKEELENAIENVASIPSYTDETLKFERDAIPKSRIGEIFKSYWPFRAIYAFDGINPDTILKHTKDYYQKNEKKLDLFPTLIAVNKKYCMRYFPKGGEMSTGEAIPKDYINLTSLNEDTQGYSIAVIITLLTDYITWMHYMRFTLSPYIDNAFKPNQENTK